MTVADQTTLSKLSSLTASSPASPLTIGIDIGKSFIDVHMSPLDKSMHLPNTAEGHQALIKAIGTAPVKACIFEATGSYSRALHSALFVAGYPTIRVNPRQSSLFLKSYTPSHKTDRSDAIGLAAMAATIALRVSEPPSPDQEASVVKKENSPRRSRRSQSSPLRPSP